MLRRCRGTIHRGRQEDDVRELERFEVEARAMRATLQRMSAMGNVVGAFSTSEFVRGSAATTSQSHHNELLELAKRYPHFHYHVALSRHETHEWEGAKGYVHDVYETISEKGKRDMDFYLCGWRNMVADAKSRIAALGYDKERVHLEVYD